MKGENHIEGEKKKRKFEKVAKKSNKRIVLGEIQL